MLTIVVLITIFNLMGGGLHLSLVLYGFRNFIFICYLFILFFIFGRIRWIFVTWRQNWKLEKKDD